MIIPIHQSATFTKLKVFISSVSPFHLISDKVIFIKKSSTKRYQSLHFLRPPIMSLVSNFDSEKKFPPAFNFSKKNKELSTLRDKLQRISKQNKSKKPFRKSSRKLRFGENSTLAFWISKEKLYIWILRLQLQRSES